MLQVKNFIPAISVEGFEDDTDFRRGDGIFKKVERAIAIMCKPMGCNPHRFFSPPSSPPVTVGKFSWC